MSGYLSFYGGRSCMALLRENGLTPDQVSVVAGAAGGPKWLILSHMDRLLFSRWFQGRSKPLFLVGSSAGAWRFAAASQNDPDKAIQHLTQGYIHQWYSSSLSKKEITRECMKIFNLYLDPKAVDEVLAHPYCRLNILSVQSRGAVAHDNPVIQGSGLLSAAAANGLKREFLKFFFKRVLFYHPFEKPPFFNMNQFPMVRIPLTHHNLHKALLASGSIPMIMEGVSHIPGAPAGIYRDGGAIDYHLDIPFLLPGSDRIVLFPHFINRVIPGWLDKKLPWRLPQASFMDNVLLICPSEKFISMLPGKKIPDRNDFVTFRGKNLERIRQWNHALQCARALRDELWDVLESGRIADRVKPIRTAAV